jgi:hypothetical protein
MVIELGLKWYVDVLFIFKYNFLARMMMDGNEEILEMG